VIHHFLITIPGEIFCTDGTNRHSHGLGSEFFPDLLQAAGYEKPLKEAADLVNPKTLSGLLSCFMKTDRPLQALSFVTLCR